MKALFLDIDGVLNSDAYDRVRDWNILSNIDETRLPLLKKIIDQTGAEIVLTSSWRNHWDNDPSKRDESGVYIQTLFEKYGLNIFGKTEDFGQVTLRGQEIKAWIELHDVATFAILDDYAFGWEDLTQYVVKTNPRFGHGLEEQHVKKVVELLNK